MYIIEIKVIVILNIIKCIKSNFKFVEKKIVIFVVGIVWVGAQQNYDNVRRVDLF